MKPVMSMYANKKDFEEAMESWLADEGSEFEESEDYYDSRGNYSPGGLYDAGGHPVPDRWADYADYIQDRMRDGDFTATGD